MASQNRPNEKNLLQTVDFSDTPFHTLVFYKKNILIDLIPLTPETSALPAGAFPRFGLAPGTVSSGVMSLRLNGRDWAEDLKHASCDWQRNDKTHVVGPLRLHPALQT